MTFCTMNLPISAKRGNESNEETFLRIIDTFMGEYDVTTELFTYEALGRWVMKCDRRFKNDTFPVAWIENEDGFLTEYFVYRKTRNDKILKHVKVEY